MIGFGSLDARHDGSGTDGRYPGDAHVLGWGAVAYWRLHAWILGYTVVLLSAFYIQFGMREFPCPLCMLQRYEMLLSWPGALSSSSRPAVGFSPPRATPGFGHGLRPVRQPGFVVFCEVVYSLAPPLLAAPDLPAEPTPESDACPCLESCGGVPGVPVSAVAAAPTVLDLSVLVVLVGAATSDAGAESVLVDVPVEVLASSLASPRVSVLPVESAVTPPVEACDIVVVAD